MRIVKFVLLALSLANLSARLSYAATPDRITSAIDSTNLVELKGHVAAMAQPDFDQGPVEPSRTLHVTMLFLPTLQQQQALDKLLAAQQNPKSPDYHKWLTADQYGERFGLSPGDLEKISAWLESQGFRVIYIAHGRDFLAFDGYVAQVESAFKTAIHYYNVNGKMHFANTTPPRIPAALSGIVGGFRGLHDFGPHSMLKKHPDYTISGEPTHFLAPGDIATIYDINPLYQASTPIDGTGQKVVIAGQSDVYLSDLHLYRTAFGLSDITGCTTNGGVLQQGACTSGNFQVVWPLSGGGDPGVISGDLSESSLDIEVMSAVARNAQIIFVTSSGGVDNSATWAIDNQLAPVISFSYGACEALVTAPSIASAETLFQQAATEGIAFFAASGDAASAECDGDLGNYPAVLGLSVGYPASSQYVTGVGGTEFNDGTGNYWNATNTTDGGSAKSYIPEIGWNDTILLNTSPNNFGLDGTGGGPSNCYTGTGTTTVSGFAFENCSAGFAKPWWQIGITPNDNARDVPDISFSSSNENDPYIVCVPQSEVVQGGSSTSTCAVGVAAAITTYNSLVGGTSAATPLAAGVAVLLNQALGSPFGPLNSQLYALYPNNSTTMAFHDIVAGTSNTGDLGTSDNIVACTPKTPSFEPKALQCPSGGTMGYSVAGGHNYSLVAGLGSVDVNALSSAMVASLKFGLKANPSSFQVAQGQSVDATVEVTFASGFTGTVSFTCNDQVPASLCTPPASVNATGQVSFHITTTAPTASLKRPLDRGTRIFYAALLPGLVGIMFTFGSRKRSLGGMRVLGLILALGFSTLWLGSCGGSNNSSNKNGGTPKGTYTVVVTGASGAGSNAAPFQLVVQ
jgi:subtilase family serine protease